MNRYRMAMEGMGWMMGWAILGWLILIVLLGLGVAALWKYSRSGGGRGSGT